jgi:hypothetical protein
MTSTHTRYFDEHWQHSGREQCDGVILRRFNGDRPTRASKMDPIDPKNP